MESVSIALAMLAAVLVSGALVRIIPLPIPLPLIQIALGILIAGVFEKGVKLDPEVFFLLFLPPLLFLDGWRLPKDALRRDWSSIVLLAFGLVFITVIGLGYVIHWMIPAVPLSVAFALAAIVSPTDALAVGGIARKLNVPKRVMSILEGEALFNDASGLVAFQAAVLATVTGAFFFQDAASSFIWLVSVGLGSGAVTAWGIIMFRNLFNRRFGDEPGSDVLLSLLTPFGAYFVAEWLDASGILAAVAAGLVTGYAELSSPLNALSRTRRHTVWEMVQFTLNGIMFVLLGEQLPNIFQDAVTIITETGHHNPWWLPIYALVICLVLALLRFAWTYGTLQFSRLLSRKTLRSTKTDIRAMLILSAGGVRGAITLAGVMTLPFVLDSGEPFPGRELAIMLAATTIIVSMLVASISLPLLLRGQPPSTDTYHIAQHTLARQQARQAANTELENALRQMTPELQDLEDSQYADAVTHILANLDEALSEAPSADLEAEVIQRQHTERRLQQIAVNAARTAIFELAKHGRISDELAREMVRRLDLNELRLY